MRKNSIDLSDRIDPGFLEVTGAITRVTGTLSIPFFLIGAACRDLILDTIVLKILGEETGDRRQYPLIEQMKGEAGFEERLNLLENLKAGLTDSI